MSLRLIGKKKGMTQIFDKEGNPLPCTVISLEENIVTQIKTEENDGYTALQLASIGKKKPNKPESGHFARAQSVPCLVLTESKDVDINQYNLGQKIDASYFAEGDFVDIEGVSKGKGYQGVMKLHGFSGMRKSHGAGPTHRHAGSTGMRSTPGRCLPGGKRASHMGVDKVTVQNLVVLQVDPANRVLVIKGAVPGSIDGVVYISKALKGGR